MVTVSFGKPLLACLAYVELKGAGLALGWAWLEWALLWVGVARVGFALEWAGLKGRRSWVDDVLSRPGSQQSYPTVLCVSLASPTSFPSGAYLCIHNWCASFGAMLASDITFLTKLNHFYLWV